MTGHQKPTKTVRAVMEEVQADVATVPSLTSALQVTQAGSRISLVLSSKAVRRWSRLTGPGSQVNPPTIGQVPSWAGLKVSRMQRLTLSCSIGSRRGAVLVDTGSASSAAWWEYLAWID